MASVIATGGAAPFTPIRVLEGVDGRRVFNITASRTLPEWLNGKSLKSGGSSGKLRYDKEFRTRVELVSGAEFETSAQRLRLSRDGDYLAATGVYSPTVKVFELPQLSEKFSRGLDAQVLQFDILTDDYSKMVFLRVDRTVEFHARYGHYFITRVPKPARDLVYQHATCDLFVCGASSDVYRLNLWTGHHFEPLHLRDSEINVARTNTYQNVLAFGGVSGLIEFVDPRDRKSLSILDVNSKVLGEQCGEITSLAFADDGLTYAVGTQMGEVLLFDMRSTAPLVRKEHMNDLPVIQLQFCKGQTEDLVVSADAHVIKYWDRKTARTLANVEPEGRVNDFLVAPGSGLMTVAAENRKLQFFYTPWLAPAPRWCNFLDVLVDEVDVVEAAENVVYDDFKFVTQEELEEIGGSGLLASGVLKPYMHGYFMDLKLYQKLWAAAHPSESSQAHADRLSRIQAKREEENFSAIKKPSKKATVVTDPKEAADQALQSLPSVDGRFASLSSGGDFSLNPADDQYRHRLGRLEHSSTKNVDLSDVNDDDDDDDDDNDDDDDELSNMSEESEEEDSGLENDEEDEFEEDEFDDEEDEGDFDEEEEDSDSEESGNEEIQNFEKQATKGSTKLDSTLSTLQPPSRTLRIQPLSVRTMTQELEKSNSRSGSSQSALQGGGHSTLMQQLPSAQARVSQLQEERDELNSGNKTLSFVPREVHKKRKSEAKIKAAQKAADRGRRRFNFRP